LKDSEKLFALADR